MNRLLRTVSTVAAGLGSNRGELRGPSRSGRGGDVVDELRPAWRGTVVLLVMWWWRPPRLAAAGLGARNRPESGLAAGRQHPAARLVSSLGALLGLAAAVPLVAGAFLVPAPHGCRQLRTCGRRGALMAASVLLVIAAGELLLQRNYGSPEAPRSWPRQPVSPALLTTAVLALLVFLVVLLVTAAGQARLGRGPGLGSGRAAHGRQFAPPPCRRSSRPGAAKASAMPPPAWTPRCAPSPSTGRCGPSRPPSPPRPRCCC